MRRISAILFLLIVLFNLCGYKLIISCVRSSILASNQKKVDEHKYDEADLVTIKTKLDLPYYTSSDDYETAYGSVYINGINYQYVKRRIHNDTLELICLPSQAITRLQSMHDDLNRSIVSEQASIPKKIAPIKISFPNFFQPFQTFTSSCLSYHKQALSQYSCFISDGYSLRQLRPPKPG